MKPRYLENMALIATKQKGNVEKAIGSFMEMISDEVGSVDLTLHNLFQQRLHNVSPIEYSEVPLIRPPLEPTNSGLYSMSVLIARPNYNKMR